MIDTLFHHRVSAAWPLLGAAHLLACSGATPPTAGSEHEWRSLAASGITLEYHDPDAGFAHALHASAVTGRTTVEAFFERQLGGPITVRVYPNRALLTAYWRATWNQPTLEPECWMIASATHDVAVLLAPRVWSVAACGHDGTDATHVRRVIAHEIAHVLHRRVNPSSAFVVQSLSWFVEGVAVLGSGQLDAVARSRVRALVSGGYSPSTPQSALTGPSGYDVVGSMADYIDVRYGRSALSRTLTVGTEDELLEQLATSRSQFLADWREFVIR